MADTTSESFVLVTAAPDVNTGDESAATADHTVTRMWLAPPAQPHPHTGDGVRELTAVLPSGQFADAVWLAVLPEASRALTKTTEPSCYNESAWKPLVASLERSLQRYELVLQLNGEKWDDGILELHARIVALLQDAAGAGTVLTRAVSQAARTSRELAEAWLPSPFPSGWVEASDTKAMPKFQVPSRPWMSVEQDAARMLAWWALLLSHPAAHVASHARLTAHGGSAVADPVTGFASRGPVRVDVLCGDSEQLRGRYLVVRSRKPLKVTSSSAAVDLSFDVPLLQPESTTANLATDPDLDPSSCIATLEIRLAADTQ